LPTCTILKSGNTKCFNLRNICPSCTCENKDHSCFSLFEALSHQRTTFQNAICSCILCDGIKAKIKKMVLGWERCENIKSGKPHHFQMYSVFGLICSITETKLVLSVFPKFMIILFSYHSFSLRYLKLFSHELFFPCFLNAKLGK